MSFRWAIFLCSALAGYAQLLTPVWVEVGERGQAFARVIVETENDCPTAQVDGVAIKFALRRPVPRGFKPACELVVPQGARKVSVNKQVVHLPKPNPDKILAFGDTGCRISKEELQDCNDPARWPFEKVAETAAGLHADLMLHVGDYLYREVACPPDKAKECGGTPHGDNWEAWNADFFHPAAKLLAAVPWVFARGNHEDCARSWKGWGYYLSMVRWTEVCERAELPLPVQLGKFQLVVLDSSSSVENSPADLVALYAGQLSGIHMAHGWLLDHHPFWAYQAPAADGRIRTQNSGLAEAYEKGMPTGIDLILSGHAHLFEILSFGGDRPVQVVAGNGGTKLENRPLPKVAGSEIRGFKVDAGESNSVFGITEFEKKGQNWKLTLRDADGKPIGSCQIEGHEAACKETTAK